MQLRPEPDRTPPEAIASVSAAARWPVLGRLVSREARWAEDMQRRGPLARGTYEFVRFGLKQGWACLFGGAMLGLLVATKLGYPSAAPLHRYDALFLAAVALQIGMLATRLETLDEAKVICAFHVIGTIMEVHKTAVGSWIYPEPSVFHIARVPLFTGFMYACVGSYLARVWRLFDFRFRRHPPLGLLGILAVAIYANFLLDDRGFDLRWVLLAACFALFVRTRIYFKVWRQPRWMPLLAGFALVALFIWFAENIGTVTGTWLYPRQIAHWTMVPMSKLTSWFLLMIVSYTLVAWINGIAIYDDTRGADTGPLAYAGAESVRPLPSGGAARRGDMR